MQPEEIKAKILELTKEYSRLVHKSNRPGNTADINSFKKGITTVAYAGRVFDDREVVAAIDSTLDFWLTLGKHGEVFEKQLAKFINVKHSVLVNSGSSANLLAISALSSYKLDDRRIKYGDEIITVAAGFPTTVAPIIQNGFVPVFIDTDPTTLNADVSVLEEAYQEGKTKAVMMAHTLGNPFNLSAVKEFCKQHNLWLIEDNCDALGCLYNGRLTGSFGDLSTQSFYPPHHLTLGEGGAVNIVGNNKLKVIVESFRDWGRDCWCASGCDNTCGKRFEWQLGELPDGYDHKFIYSHLGYNLKPLDIQAAIGIEQLKKLPDFIQARIDNWEYLRKGMNALSDYFSFMLPTHATGWTENGFIWDGSGNTTVPSWFGFMLRVKSGAPFSKFELVRYLDNMKIGNRSLFGGNLTRQPAFINLINERPGSYRIVGDLKGADKIMNETLFIGTYPGLTKPMMDYMLEAIYDFTKKY
ncbi:MAG TPA: lipopolysaccharide biosynthesis protein RfbH [Mucilaginibacter sp.]|jgi:CDP-6-deoxy-D-xylo-4-hexulose-3-dehydrase|nr:lipopolysaccharide biosynthesis protein RfbH [Mucilaginibacter sp.]